MAKKLSNVVKPEGMSYEEWQKKLRSQIAAKEVLSISPHGDDAAYGWFDVRNPKTKNLYKVVYRGVDSRWNYCSCMDFRTNQLGTCKHVEAVRMWLDERHKMAPVVNPPYSSLYISYRGDRCVCLRKGSAHWAEMTELAGQWFDADGMALDGSLPRMSEFIAKAREIDPDFRCYPDVTDYLAEMKDAAYRERYLSGVSDADLDNLLKTELYPYQKEGIRFAFRKGKSILADEMGLGKTVQAIGTAELMRKAGLISSVLILCPASLKYQWKKEIERFTGSEAVVVDGTQDKRGELYKSQAFYKIASYHAMSNDVKAFGPRYAECLIMDEVQRLKNWNSQISRAARKIQSDYSVVLSGTPLENKLEELYSVMEFVDQYCLGPYYKFIDIATVKDANGKIVSYRNLNKIGERLAERMLRRRKADVSLQLPDRVDQNLFVPMTPQQKELHDGFKVSVAQLVSKWKRMHFLSDKDRKRMLLLLSQMRMVCDSTYILDQETRCDTKVDEAVNIIRNVVESGDSKVVVFSQWERMTRLVAAEMERAGIGYSSLSGSVPSEKRRHLMDDFCDNPACRVFISTDTGSTGLNLQAASLIINLDLPWNPAVLEQRIGRIYRIGQKRNIQVINMISKDSFEERMLCTLDVKSSLFEGVLDGGDDTVILDDSKMNRMMEVVSGYVDGEDVSSAVDNAGRQSMPRQDDVQPVEIYDPEPAAEIREPYLEPVYPADVSEEETAAAEERGEKDVDAEGLVRQGMAFLSGLAKTLQSPEATARLVDTLVHTDSETGRQEIRIPVPGKDAAGSILTLLAKLMSK